MTSTNESILWEVLDSRLADSGQNGLDHVVKQARIDGTPWRDIATSIHAMTGRTVGYQTLINWYPELNKPAAELVDSS